MSETAEPAERSSSSETLVAVLIAVTTLVGAILAWRSSVAGDAAGDADYAGLRAVVNVEETRALGVVTGSEHYSAFTNFDRYEQLAKLMEADLPAADRQLADTRDMADSNRHLFPAKFRNRDGSYARQREQGEIWADAAREKDLNPEPRFEEAERFRGKSLRLLLAVTLTAIALVFFTLVEPFGAGLAAVNIGLGTLCLLCGTVLGAYVEWAVR